MTTRIKWNRWLRQFSRSITALYFHAKSMAWEWRLFRIRSTYKPEYLFVRVNNTLLNTFPNCSPELMRTEIFSYIIYLRWTDVVVTFHSRDGRSWCPIYKIYTYLERFCHHQMLLWFESSTRKSWRATIILDAQQLIKKLI